MAAADRAAIPAAPRRTLLEWIDHDDGDTTGTTQPVCSAAVQALHTAIPLPSDGRIRFADPLRPPPGLHLAPLG